MALLPPSKAERTVRRRDISTRKAEEFPVHFTRGGGTRPPVAVPLPRLLHLLYINKIKST